MNPFIGFGIASSQLGDELLGFPPQYRCGVGIPSVVGIGIGQVMGLSLGRLMFPREGFVYGSGVHHGYHCRCLAKFAIERCVGYLIEGNNRMLLGAGMY